MKFDGYQYLKNLKKFAYNMSQITFQYYENSICEDHAPEKATLNPIFGNQYQLTMCDENNEILKTFFIPNKIVVKMLETNNPDYEEYANFVHEKFTLENLERKSNQLNRAFDELKASKISDENLIKLLMMKTQSRKPAIKEFLKE